MIAVNFEKIYANFRLELYKRVFATLGEREGSLTVTEFFAVETIGLMGNPTVSEFAEALSVTSPLAAYKVRQLIDKGYIVKVPAEDKRSFRLAVTEKFTRFYHPENSYGTYIFEILKKSLTEEELAFCDKLFEKFVETIESEADGARRSK